MKKLLLSIFAVATLFSCSKSDVIYLEEQSEIGFSPFAQNITKSVAGYDGDTFDGIFPTGIDLYVFANVEDDVTTDNFNWSDTYFSNALFRHTDEKGTTDEVANPGAPEDITATEGAYAGSPNRYWPNVKSLIFAGVSKACNINSENNGAVPSMDFANNKLTITDYVQDNDRYTAEGANDLMWFPYDGNSYTKQTNEVIANMKHACSWITIKVAGDAVTANNWKLNTLNVKSLIHAGTATCAAAGATWSFTNEQKDAADDEVYYSSTEGTTFTTTATKYESTTNNFIVLPQEPTELEVTYTYVSDATNNISITETKSVSLDYDKAGTAWQSGVHYIYTITITANEILIDPYVAEWTEYDSDSALMEISQ